MAIRSGIRQPNKWIAFPFNGALDYTDFGAGYQAVQYRRDALGYVELRGVAKKATAGVANQVMGTLPAGFRPAATVAFPALISGGTATRIDVASSGTVTLVGTPGANNAISWGVIRFWPTGEGQA